MYRKRINQDILSKVIVCEPDALEEKIEDWLYGIKCSGNDLIKYKMKQSAIIARDEESDLMPHIVLTIMYTIQSIEIS